MKKVLLSDRSLQLLFGPLDENVKFLENLFAVTIQARDSALTIDGEEEDVNLLETHPCRFFWLWWIKGHNISNGDLKSAFKQIAEDARSRLHDFFPKMQLLTAGKRQVTPKSLNQRRYVEAIRQNDIVFGIGPGGTGKTFLAVAMALTYLLEKERVAHHPDAAGRGSGRTAWVSSREIWKRRSIPTCVRFMMRSISCMEAEKIQRYMETGVIEIAPLAFMRGRTLNDAFIILDEAQNTTSEQMKMFLTRIGLHSKAVITGDVTQIDLPLGRNSGLVEARNILSDVEGLAFCYFNEGDVVRHHLVRLIIKAYQQHAQNGSGGNGNGRKDA